jgi:hypothetical protein
MLFLDCAVLSTHWRETGSTPTSEQEEQEGGEIIPAPLPLDMLRAVYLVSAYCSGIEALREPCEFGHRSSSPVHNERDEILLAGVLFPYQLQFDVPAVGFGVRREPTLGRRVLREGRAQRGARHTTDTDQQEHSIPARVPSRRSC